MRYVRVGNETAVGTVGLDINYDLSMTSPSGETVLALYKYSPNGWIYRKTDYRYQIYGSFIAEMGRYHFSLRRHMTSGRHFENVNSSKIQISP